jgi:protocatechuate 3,4-dioxygenase beta subunit
LTQFIGDALAAPWSLQVVDENGAPVQAHLRLWSWQNGDPWYLETDAKGRAAGDIPSDSKTYLATVFIFAPGHAPSGGALRPGENRARLGAPHTLRGRVVDDNGKPLPNVLVELTNIMADRLSGEKLTLENSADFFLFEREKPFFATRTGIDGRYEIHNLPARGTAIVAVGDPLWQNVSARADLQNTIIAPDLVTRPAARLRGRVLNEDGTPVAGKSVYASSDKNYVAADTDASGGYLLGGLPAGKISVRVAEAPTRDAAVALPVEVVAIIGEEIPVPDIRMTPGALLEIAITPPVSGGYFDLRREDLPRTEGGFYLKAEDGKIRARVRPGTYRLKINTPPKGWIAPADWPADGLKIEAVASGAGSTPSQKIAIRLEPALTLTGIARDETGAPVAGATFQEGNNAMYQADGGASAVSNSNGRFVMRDLKPGELTLSTGAQWDIVSPKKVTLPAAKPVAVTLRKVTLVPLRGRVVDSNGKPIADARVTIAWLGPVNDDGGYDKQGSENLRTDADGRYEMRELRSDAQITVKAQKAHFRFLGGGELSIERTIQAIDGGRMPNPNAVFNVSDLILQSLERQATGRVLEANGTPVANAIVGALGGGQEEFLVAPRNIARTDSEGRFQLGDLPEGKLGFVAGAGNGFAQIQSQLSTLPDMVLQSQTTPEEDWELARKIVMDLIATTGNDYWARSALPYTLAFYDYGAALEAANAMHPDKPNQPDDLRTLVSVWIDSSPESARAALPAMLPTLERKPDGLWFGGFVAQVAGLLQQPQQKVVPGEAADAAMLRAWVRKHFERMRDKAAAVDLSKYNDLEMAYSLSHLAVLSEILGEADADKWAQAAIEIAARYDALQKSEYAGDGVPATAEGLAAGGARLAQAALRFVPPPQRAYALGRMIPELAKDDLPGARRLLELLPQQIKPQDTRTSNADPEWAFGLAAKAILRRMSTPDAADALALARRVTNEFHRGEALALAARLQPEPERAALFREAFELATKQPSNRKESLIVGIALESDPKIGNELLGKIEDAFFDSARWPLGEPISVPAFYMAKTQPGRARAWLEWKWARAQNTVRGINGPIELKSIAMAMSAVSTSRALEMANAIPPQLKADGSEDLTWRWEAKRKIAQYLMAPESARRTLNFARWNASDTWTPGTETGW